tara:strand:+ start:3520 stop:4746 length:1227 start_codon:yes stop_codon:yes gene_type:complete
MSFTTGQPALAPLKLVLLGAAITLLYISCGNPSNSEKSNEDTRSNETQITIGSNDPASDSSVAEQNTSNLQELSDINAALDAANTENAALLEELNRIDAQINLLMAEQGVQQPDIQTSPDGNDPPSQKDIDNYELMKRDALNAIENAKSKINLANWVKGEAKRHRDELNRLSTLNLNVSPSFSVSGFPSNRSFEVVQLAGNLRESVVILRSPGGNGTGFIHSDNLVITNEHVIAGSYTGSIEVITFSGKTLQAELIGADANADIALLRTESNMNLPKVKWGKASDLVSGDPLFAIGHPGQVGFWALTAGIFTFNEKMRINHNVYSTVPGMVGSSGSPIFNMNGEVVGVIYSGQPMGQTEGIDIEAGGIGYGKPIKYNKILSFPIVVERSWTTGTQAEHALEIISGFSK